MARKLDRVLLNHAWLDRFDGAEACFHDPGASDHSPMTVMLRVDLHHRKSPFKFFNFWTTNSLFGELVAQASNVEIARSLPYKFCQRLKLVKIKMKELNRTQYSNIQQRTSQARLKTPQYPSINANQPGEFGAQGTGEKGLIRITSIQLH